MKKIAYLSAGDSYWEEMGELYQEMGLDEFVEHLCNEHPEAVYEEPEEEEPADYEIENENEHYVVCYRDGMDECIIIYQKEE